jgi:hypothetical protein
MSRNVEKGEGTTITQPFGYVLLVGETTCGGFKTLKRDKTH